MKLYMHPVSMTSRPVRLFVAEERIPVEEVVVDLMQGEHYQPAFAAVNPSRQVPVLEEDDGFRLSESSAILKYLAEKAGSQAYPRELRPRARVNEMMDWLNTGFYREYGYGLFYPQIFPNHKRPSETAQQACLEWAKERAAAWLRILDEHWIGPRNAYLGGDRLTLADYFGSGFVSLGELCGMDFARYPNVKRWLDNMEALPSWSRVNEVFYGFRDALKGQAFVTV